MNPKCHTCGSRQLTAVSDKLFRIGIPWLTNFLQRKADYSCGSCGTKIDDPLGISYIDRNRPIIPVPLGATSTAIQRTLGFLLRFGGSPQRPIAPPISCRY